jgi:hypothetical protein
VAEKRDNLTLLLGEHIVRHILEFIEPEFLVFALCTCSFWNNLLRFYFFSSSYPFFTSLSPLFISSICYALSSLPLSLSLISSSPFLIFNFSSSGRSFCTFSKHHFTNQGQLAARHGYLSM